MDHACAGRARSRLLPPVHALLAVAALAGCGNGDGGAAGTKSATTEQAPPPPSLTLFPPRNVPFTNRMALAWANGPVDDRVLVRVEQGLGFAPTQEWMLRHDGPSGRFEITDVDPETGDPKRARFEVRYADGFFQLAALDDNRVATSGSLPFGVDVYPAGVEPVTPDNPCGSGAPRCYNGYFFVPWQSWPTRAGATLHMPVPRRDSSGMTFSVQIQPTDQAPFAVTGSPVSGALVTEVERGAAWRYDFPTTRARLRGCRGGNDCIDSAAQPLEAALLRGIVRIRLGAGSHAQVALSADGRVLAVKSSFDGPGESATPVFLYERGDNGAWGRLASVDDAAAGFGRAFALSGDGNTLAVEASTCEASSPACTSSAVIVYRRGEFEWNEIARFDGARRARLNHDGTRLIAIGFANGRSNRLRTFVRSGDAWKEQSFPALGFEPLDIALDAAGATVAVARASAAADPCGCRAVVVYVATANGWRESAVLHSNRRTGAGAEDDDRFGAGRPGAQAVAVSADGTTIVVGASGDSGDVSDPAGDPGSRGAPQSGAVYVFRRDGDAWPQRAFLKTRGAAAQDFAGHIVAVNADGSVVAAGARGIAAHAAGVHRNHAADQTAAAPDADFVAGSAAYVFVQSADDGGWTQRASVIPPTSGRVDFEAQFGLAMSADAATIAMGTGERAAGGAGVVRAAFVY